MISGYLCSGSKFFTLHSSLSCKLLALSFLDHTSCEADEFLITHASPLNLQLSLQEVLQHHDALFLGKLLTEDAIVIATPILLSNEVCLLPIKAVELDTIQEGMYIPLSEVIVTIKIFYFLKRFF